MITDSPYQFSAGEQIRSAYFIGIGGIGMSAIARFFQTMGIAVSGYDKTETALTKELAASGIPVHYSDDVALIPKDAGLVVYTPAVPEAHAGLRYYRDKGYRVVKRSDVLQLLTEHSFNICVAGTHGKTTISTMTAHLLRDSGFGCNAFLGGIAVNYGRNCWHSEKNVCVAEADEYDRSFLKLSPDIAVITAMDPDHLDIYGTGEAMEQAFIDFSHKIKPGGVLIRQFGLKRGRELGADQQLTYSLQNEAADCYAANIRMDNGSYHFDVVMPGETLEGFLLHMGGMHNVENAVAAISVARLLNISTEKIKAAVESFRGVKRRFEYVLKNDRIVLIDDYAHHPEELRALISGAKSLFRQKKCTVIFQPHLFTRTRDLAAGFAAALDMADETILLPIYPARELPIEGVSSGLITAGMEKKGRIMEKQALLEWIGNEYVPAMNREFGEILILAGAGDIDTLVEPVKEKLKNS